ncbi:MAG: UDP-N-acetylglucosamine 2-epimerase (non-hydrolyzing) [Verrucomicrobia bacterium]|nr:UDP-N-acetylglucosamine 2-epimerase (non-hydrolyzing) [Verrucomicrobiota bacterium]MCH8513400.1 UDP-N-acetylglucosamine 2-epimerase (non-hydrolyzing) [Kiritimatiellia bacterium]
MPRILTIFGTRPEAIKLAPLVHAFGDHPDIESYVCVTAQHREMLDQVMDFFELRADHDLDLMTPGQTLSGLAARILTALDPVIADLRPDWVVVQGDTTTSMAAALAAFHRGARVCHIEAGLRTGNRHSPFPEEINRRLTSILADLHMAPTDRNRDALLREGVPADRVHITGNTVIDALLLARERVNASPPAALREFAGKDLVLVTGHRRESFGAGFENICAALRELSDRFHETLFVYPVHLNPNVLEPVHRVLGGRANVRLIEPLAYPGFVWLMDQAKVILTDSGGVQEEAPSLGKPVLVMRDTTEREEGVTAGTAKLVGTDREAIVRETARLLTDPAAWRTMSEAGNPYGDGKACERILRLLLEEEHAD